MGDIVSFRRASAGRAHRKAERSDTTWVGAARSLGVVLVAAPLGLFCAILLADGPPELRATPGRAQAAAPAPLVQAHFGPCLGGVRTTCVVDGDTIWLHGEKIRIADIDAPEISDPACEAEHAAGMRATALLTAWLNEGAFEVRNNPDGRDEDVYGRKLRVLARGGTSAVEVLVAEGLATRWGEARPAWC